jgi:hypothetical protein
MKKATVSAEVQALINQIETKATQLGVIDHVLDTYNLYNLVERQDALLYLKQQYYARKDQAQAQVSQTTTSQEPQAMLVVEHDNKGQVVSRTHVDLDAPAPEAAQESPAKLALLALLDDLNASIDTLTKRREETLKALAAYDNNPQPEPTKPEPTKPKSTKVRVEYTKAVKKEQAVDQAKLLADVELNKNANLFVTRAMCNRWLEANGHERLSNSCKLDEVRKVAASILDNTLVAKEPTTKATKTKATKTPAAKAPSAKQLRDAAKAQGVDISSTNMRSSIERTKAGQQLGIC